MVKFAEPFQSYGNNPEGGERLLNLANHRACNHLTLFKQVRVEPNSWQIRNELLDPGCGPQLAQPTNLCKLLIGIIPLRYTLRFLWLMLAHSQTEQSEILSKWSASLSACGDNSSLKRHLPAPLRALMKSFFFKLSIKFCSVHYS